MAAPCACSSLRPPSTADRKGRTACAVNRVWRNGHDGNPLFVDRAALSALLADALYGVPLLDTPAPDLPCDARVCVNIRRGEDVYETAEGWTYSMPIRADDGGGMSWSARRGAASSPTARMCACCRPPPSRAACAVPGGADGRPRYQFPHWSGTGTIDPGRARPARFHICPGSGQEEAWRTVR